MNYLSVEEAVNAPGLRLVLTAGVPGPWGEAAKAMLVHKGLEFIPVAQEGGGENQALMDWTGQNSAPVLAFEDWPPVSHWLEALYLAEELAPQAPLLGYDAAERAQVLGFCALMSGRDGLAWNRRLQMLAPIMRLDEPPPAMARMGEKYGWSEQALAAAPGKLRDITGALREQLETQKKAGRDYLVGTAVSAADFYLANFVGMFEPLPPESNPMPDFLRAIYSHCDEATRACVSVELIAHRDMMYQRHIDLPLDF